MPYSPFPDFFLHTLPLGIASSKNSAAWVLQAAEKFFTELPDRVYTNNTQHLHFDMFIKDKIIYLIIIMQSLSLQVQVQLKFFYPNLFDPSANANPGGEDKFNYSAWWFKTSCNFNISTGIFFWFPLYY